MSKKIISMLLALTIGVISTGPIFETKAYAFDAESIMRVSVPTVPGNEDIISHSTTWKYGVTQPTSLGAAVNIISAFLGLSGLPILEDTAKNYIATQIAGFMMNKVFSLSNTVNIKLDKYLVRGANGRTYYKVYASYYKLDGTFICSNLVQG